MSTAPEGGASQDRAAAGDYDARGKSPADIEHDIGDTRAELGAALDALERQLMPRLLFEKGVEMAWESIRRSSGLVGATMRSNPLPLGLIAAGVGWLLLGRATVQQAVAEPDLAYARSKPLTDDAAMPPTAIGRVATRARGLVDRAVEEDAIALGLIGLLTGAALGLLLPHGVRRGARSAAGSGQKESTAVR